MRVSWMKINEGLRVCVPLMILQKIQEAIFDICCLRIGSSKRIETVRRTSV